MAGADRQPRLVGGLEARSTPGLCMIQSQERSQPSCRARRERTTDVLVIWLAADPSESLSRQRRAQYVQRQTAQIQCPAVELLEGDSPGLHLVA